MDENGDNNSNGNRRTPYPLSRATLDFLSGHAALLPKVPADVVVAMTAESLCYLGDGEDDTYDARDVRPPTRAGQIRTVFGGEDTYHHSHLFVLSNLSIPGERPLRWVDREITAELISEEMIVHVASTVFKGCVKIRHSYDCFFVLQANSKLKVDGVLPALPGGVTQEAEGVSRKISSMLDRFAMCCIEGKRLKSPVELRGFNVRGGGGGRRR